jgi:hypothetical protein
MARSADEEAVQDIKDPKARKEAYYTRQRQNAKVGSKESGKIASKLGWGGEARALAKDTMSTIKRTGPLSMPGGEGAEAVEGAGRALGGVTRKALSGARDEVGTLAKRAEGAVEGAYQRLRNPTPVKQALGNRKPALGSAKSQSKSLSPAEKYSAKKASNNSPKSMQGNQRKALSSSGQWHYEKELGKQAGRKLPKEPKTFNRNGTKRTEGRQKSDRNPVSARAKPKSTAKSAHMDKWSQ